jgi:hypothetical protein
MVVEQDTGAVASYGSNRVLWREGRWRCELANVQQRPVLRLYAGEKLDFEHEMLPGIDPAPTAQVLHRLFVRHASGGDRLAES